MSEQGESKLDLLERIHQIRLAAELAQGIVESAQVQEPPVDLYEIADAESEFLTVLSGDYEDAFDGELRYSANEDHFLLFFNTKYDKKPHAGRHHPRARFSFAHELGHYYLAHHRNYLRSGGASHQSKGEFENASVQIEREADAFAAGLMMPDRLFRPRVNDGRELSFDRVRDLATLFQASVVATASRAVQVSDLPCAIVAVKNGRRTWSFQSPIVIDAKCYPAPKGKLRSRTAMSAWSRFSDGASPESAEAPLAAWFTAYNRRNLDDVLVSETYLPVRSMNTLLVLLTMDEDDLFA